MMIFQASFITQAGPGATVQVVGNWQLWASGSRSRLRVREQGPKPLTPSTAIGAHHLHVQVEVTQEEL
jgi:hypothetical protein